ncbi:phosphoribosylglycinamide formyltransferase [Ascodesmis nigricans]|uniref:phosphoribosylglycinamide formyltransferase 1 n=1 Tax=Ascodesmis nigricans TaxID=341454 RepID=A0A4S2N275_9PEZI|nr:phosphoribosylglycinamide formyltransferase [Ascodesmis nigricans]
MSSSESTSQVQKTPLLVLLSGSGTNFAALLRATETPANPLSSLATITHVISNRKSAYGLTRARDANIPTTYHNLQTGGYSKKHPNDPAKAREEYDHDLADIILALDPRPEVIVCAGWMHILSPAFLNPLEQAGIEIINLHPALKGEFDGIDAIGRAYIAFKEGKITRTGVMVHRVIAAVDQGPLVLQQEIPILEDDTKESLEERIHGVEWEVIVEGTTRVVKERRENKEKGLIA